MRLSRRYIRSARRSAGSLAVVVLAAAWAALLPAAPLPVAPPGPAQACDVEASRRFGAAAPAGAAWGDEVDVTIELALACPPGMLTRLEVTEALPAGMAPVPGVGRAPDAVRASAVTWRFDAPAVSPAGVRWTYRVYATPDAAGSMADTAVDAAWPMLLDAVVAGTPRRLPLPDVPTLAVRPRASLGCALARTRAIEPPVVFAGAPFTVSLRVEPNTCAPVARRTRGVFALQPFADAASMQRLALVQSAALDPSRVLPADGMFGVVANLAAGPIVRPPTTAYVVLEDLTHALLPDAGADAAAALAAALDAVDDWPGHHELVVYITHAGAPRADPAAVAGLLAAARGRGVEIAAMCVGGGCDPALVYAHAAPDLATLRREVAAGLVDRFRGPAPALDAIEVEERLFPFVQLEPGSLDPPGDPAAGAVRWRVDRPAAGRSIALAYRARVNIPGRLPLESGGTAWAIHAGGDRHPFDLPKGEVRVERNPDAPPPPCRAAVDKSAAPARLPLGDTVTIQLAFGAECPGDERPVDVMLALDVSGSMEGRRLVDAQAAALAFLDVVEPGPVRAGLVAFNHGLADRLPPTDDWPALRAAIRALTADGGTDIAAAVDAAGADLLTHRRPDAAGVIVVLTDGFNNLGPEPMLRAAAAAKLQGAWIVTTCFGGAGACDPRLPEVASLPRHHFVAPTAEDLLRVFVELGAWLRQAGVRSARITDVLPTSLRYVAGSAEPSPVEVRPADAARGETLVWDVVPPRIGATLVRYTAEPLVLGDQATNLEARVEYVDDVGRAASAVFPIPRVETYLPDPAGPCTPRLTKTAAPDRLASGEPTTVTLGAALDCPSDPAPQDVVVVLDHSASMGALDRLANAKRAVGALLDGLDPTVARVGLVTFSDAVTGRVALTADFGAVRRAVDALRPAGQTGIAQALNAAREALNARRPDAVAAVILVTDGANTAGAEPMLAAAERLKRTGALVVTVCAGTCDAALPAAASGPAHAFAVTDSAALVDLFRALAAGLGGDRPRDLVITDAFPSAVTVDPTSYTPPPDAAGPGGAVWRFPDLPDGGLTLRYVLRPVVAGRVPANRFARLDYRFGVGETGRAFFPLPILDVAAPPPSATPGAGTPATPGPGTPTPGTPGPATTTPGMPSGTPSATPGAVTPPPATARAFLPYGSQPP